MSTITKLDPMHRVRRAERRNTIRALRRALPLMDAAKRFTAMIVIQSLELVRLDPALSGDDKHAIFINALKENSK